jgi:hypothetical protein
MAVQLFVVGSSQGGVPAFTNAVSLRQQRTDKPLALTSRKPGPDGKVSYYHSMVTGKTDELSAPSQAARLFDTAVVDCDITHGFQVAEGDADVIETSPAKPLAPSAILGARPSKGVERTGAFAKQAVDGFVAVGDQKTRESISVQIRAETARAEKTASITIQKRGIEVTKDDGGNVRGQLCEMFREESVEQLSLRGSA